MSDAQKFPAKFAFVYAACAILMCLFSFLFNPLYVIVSTDIAYQTSIIPLLLTIGSKLSEALFSGLVLAVAAAGEYFFAERKTARTVNRVVSLAAFPLMRIANFVADAVVNGVKDFIFSDYLGLLLPAVLEALVSLFVILSVARRLEEKFAADRGIAKAMRVAGTDAEDGYIVPVFPMKRLFPRQNPIATGFFTGSLILYGMNLISDLYYEIGLGWPASGSEWLEVAVHYISLFLLWAACYLTARICCGAMGKEKMNTED